MTDPEEVLKTGIVKALGWDAFVAEGVVKAIAEAGARALLKAWLLKGL
jgi:hypothetical protein